MIKPRLNKQSLVALALIACVATPLVLSRLHQGARQPMDDNQRRLTIITPHNETIRREFGEAFQQWWQQKTGESIYVNWLTPGGTSEISMVLDSRFAAAEKRGDPGVEIDLFFGGGDYPFRQQAQKKRFTTLDVFEQHPEWFNDQVIPASFTGETYYDPDHQWVGVCLARFGICYNVDALKRRGLKPPTRWSDLADPRYHGGIALADPTKSGSVARAFEMLVQEQMHATLREGQRQPGKTQQQFEMRVRSEGWDKGLNLIQKIAANARYFTDSATKIPRDVAQGDAVAGMCVDFYGLTYEEMHRRPDGSSRIRWISPRSGTSMSTDPVAIFRGAPEPELAQAFVEFLLSRQGQLLWNVKPGTPGGPQYRALRRMPLRRDLYTPETMARFTDPVNPYQQTADFTYRPELTAKGFGALRFIIRVMCLDAHDELKTSWQNLARYDFPERASTMFSDVTVVSYQNAMGGIRRQLASGNALETAKLSVRLGKFFRRNYRRAARLARKGEPRP